MPTTACRSCWRTRAIRRPASAASPRSAPSARSCGRSSTRSAGITGSAMAEPRPALVAHARLRWDKRANATMLLAPERGLVLDEIAAVVVAMCNGTRTIEDIARALHPDYPDVTLETI